MSVEQAGAASGELYGMYAHLYGLSREDVAYILTTFPVLKKNEERQYGEYRATRAGTLCATQVMYA